jgi:RNA polymerase sigma-70 factor (ECF subfamily)
MAATDVAAREALAQALRQHGDRLFALALRVTRDADLAADAVQNAFASALERIDDFRGEAALGTWLHRITYNKAIDQLRLRGREVPLEDEPGEGELLALAHAPSWSDPDRPLAAAQLRAALEEALGELTPVQRAVFELKEEEGRSSEEIGEILGLPAGTVRVHLHRGRLRLRARLSQSLGRTN